MRDFFLVFGNFSKKYRKFWASFVKICSVLMFCACTILWFLCEKFYQSSAPPSMTDLWIRPWAMTVTSQLTIRFRRKEKSSNAH